jgi:hypothetical protein
MVVPQSVIALNRLKPPEVWNIEPRNDRSQRPCTPLSKKKIQLKKESIPPKTQIKLFDLTGKDDERKRFDGNTPISAGKMILLSSTKALAASLPRTMWSPSLALILTLASSPKPVKALRKKPWSAGSVCVGRSRCPVKAPAHVPGLV